MNLHHSVLFVLLGLLTASKAAVTRQFDDDHIASMGEVAVPVNHELHGTWGEELAGRQGGPIPISQLLLRYDLICPVDAKDTPNAPNMPGSKTPNQVCRAWFECKPDGTKYQKKKLERHSAWYRLNKERVGWCNQWCICWLQDKPEQHFAYNQGCVDPLDKIIQGQYGSAARDTASIQPLSNDGLVMEAFEGPPRKD